MYEFALGIVDRELSVFRQAVEDCEAGKIDWYDVNRNILNMAYELRRAIGGSMRSAESLLEDGYGNKNKHLSELERTTLENHLKILSDEYECASSIYDEADKLSSRIRGIT